MFWRTALAALLIFLNCVVFVRMMWGTTGILEYRKLNEKHMQLTQELAALEKNNVDLSQEIRLLQADKAYIEKTIRHRLHYMRANEVLYLFDASDSDSSSDTVESEKSVKADQN